MTNDQPFREIESSSRSCQVFEVLDNTSFAISWKLITACLIKPNLMEKMGPYFSAQDVKVWCGFFFVNCNRLPNIESPRLATHKSSKPKHCNSYYIEDMCDTRFVDQVFVYIHYMYFSRTYYYCLYITISFLKVSISNFVIEMLCLKLFANDNFQNHLRKC